VQTAEKPDAEKKERLGWFFPRKLARIPPRLRTSYTLQPSRCPFNDRSFENQLSNVYARLWEEFRSAGIQGVQGTWTSEIGGEVGDSLPLNEVTAQAAG
jgi:hypothetical protein